MSHTAIRPSRQANRKSAAAAAEYSKRAFPAESIPHGAMARALDQIQQFDKATPRVTSSYVWYNLGPAPMSSSQQNFSQNVSGRVTCLAVDPSNQSHWLIGAAQGGVWETTDSGGHWTPRTDNQVSLAMGAIAFAPGNPSLVYAGTGEPNFSGDSYAGGGLLVSHDGGTNWQVLNSSFAESAFSAIKVDVFNANNVSATTVRGIAGLVSGGSKIPPGAPPRGVFVSANGGTNFTRVLTGEATDLISDPNHFNRQYAALGEIFGSPTNGIYRTTNGWASSQPINGPWTSIAAPTNIGRIALAISPVITGTVYAGVSYDADTGGLIGIWRTDNAWDPSPVWTNLPSPSTGPFLWYSFALNVDPNDYTSVYLSELTVWKLLNGTWSDVGSFIHADNHAMAWVPQGFGTYRLLLGNDGGVWFSSQPVSSSWNDLNTSGLSISQMYKGSVHPKPNTSLILAGTQDNGTAENLGGLVWNHILTGDGADNAISSANPDTDWAASWETIGFGINIYRTQNAGTNMDNQSFGIDPINAPFFVHFEKSPKIDDLFIAGTVQLWRCTNFFSGTYAIWESNSPVMMGTNGLPVTISAMAFAPSDTNGLTYGFGTQDGQLRITLNGGGSWSDLDPANGVPNRYVSGLAFNPTNADILYVTLSGFDENTPSQPGHVFKSTNARAASPSWSNISPPVNLPNDCIAIDPNNPNNIFIGADIGVWSSANAGLSWTHLGPETGMPNVAVYDLRMNSVSQVTAFTHGRGAFTYAPGVPIIAVAGPVRPYDLACLSCPNVNWLNPGDLVSVQLPLQSILPIDTVNLTATMLSSPQVSPIRGTANYGVIHGQGATVSRAFSFIAGASPGTPGVAACGDAVNVVLQLNDGGADLGQVSFPFHLGIPSHPLAEEFDEVATPGLPPGWASSTSGTGVPWVTTSNSPPNAVPTDAPDDGDVSDIPDSSYPPNVSAFTPASSGIGQSFLVSAPFNVATPQAQLYFRQAYLVSNAWDGCILEISIAGQAFQDIVQAGGSFSKNGYNLVLKDNNPLGPRSAWSGNSGGWLPVFANLPASASGQTVQLRWHFGTSRGLTNGGWFVDAPVITEPQCLPPVTNPVIVNPTVKTNSFSFSIDTVSGRTYVIEYKTNLTDNAWQFFENLPGNATRQTVTVPADPTSSRFFRFHLNP